MATSDASSSQNTVHRYANALRAMPIKVVYTLNDNIHQFFLARHQPIAVRVIQKPAPTRRQRQQAAKQIRAQRAALNSTPSSAKKSTPTRRSQTAAAAAVAAGAGDMKNEVINVDDSPIDDHLLDDLEEHVEYGFAPLKVCITAVWAASPDLAYDRSRDWSVYCLDPREQSHVYDSSSIGSVASKFSGVMTGMGLVSHALAEDERTLTPVSVAGKIIEDQGGEALEVILQMKPTMAPPPAMAAQFAGWQHPMMFGFPQHPGFFRPIPAFPQPPKAQNPRRTKSSNQAAATAAAAAVPGTSATASTPASVDATSPDASTPAPEPSQKSTELVRSSSIEPKPAPPTTTNHSRKKKGGNPFTQQPLARSSSPPTTELKVAKDVKATSAIDVFASLASRLNSIDGGVEPPPSNTAEGQLLDCMVAWLKTAAGSRLSEAIGITPAEIIEVPNSPATSLDTLLAPPEPTSSQLQSSSQPMPSSSQSSANVAPPKPANRSLSGGKGTSKPMNRSLSGPNAARKRALDDEEYGPNKTKRLKTGRTVSGSSQPSAPISFSQPLAPPDSPVNVKGKGIIALPSSSEILGIRFAPKRAYTLDLNQPTDEGTVKKKAVPEPETPRPRKKATNLDPSSDNLAPTSPFISRGDMDDSLFSEAGTPAVTRMFSPFKPLSRRPGSDDPVIDVARPSSPCERRVSTGTVKGVNAEPKAPVRMLGGRLASSSPPDVRTPQPRWNVDLPPSSPPPPSSPIVTDGTSSTPADPEEDAEGTDKTLTQLQAPSRDFLAVNESPSKVFARYFGQDSRSDTEDLTDALVSGPPSTYAPSTPTSEADDHFGLGALDFGSSSSFSLEDLGWPENEIFNAGSEIDADGEGLSEVEPPSDLDFDVGELLSWMQNNTGIPSTQDSNSSTASSNPNRPPPTTASLQEQDPLRELLGGCVV
ncbi:hypothetical protein CPB86DRAFT_767584 [Serendipita vermifera]|nr:hypothetical protein CPB86DRAFT_767584 [Serendipita vermifera]